MRQGGAMSEYGSDWGEVELDPEEQERADVNLDEPDAMDDEPWSPPERRPRGAELIGEETEDGGETIEQRIRQEEPEVGTAYGAPDPGGEYAETEPDMLGGDDPAAIPADTDVLGGTPSEDLFGEGGSPEQAAMHVVDDEPDQS